MLVYRKFLCQVFSGFLFWLFFWGLVEGSACGDLELMPVTAVKKAGAAVPIGDKPVDAPDGKNDVGDD